MEHYQKKHTLVFGNHKYIKKANLASPYIGTLHDNFIIQDIRTYLKRAQNLYCRKNLRYSPANEHITDPFAHCQASHQNPER